jgi:hypothetical protein
LLSPGGYSVFINIYESLVFMGVKTDLYNWNDDFESKFNQFKPNVFITSDDINYINRINWTFIKKYKKNNNLRVGLTASIAEYGNTPIDTRISWAIENNVDFYYSFRDFAF